MKSKKFLIIFSILIGLVFYSGVLANPSDKYEEIKAKLAALSPERCNSLSGQAKIDCINDIINEINRLKAELDKYSQEIGEKVDELQKDIQSLNNQVSYLNAKIEKTEIEIALKGKEINILELDIAKAEEEIKEKEKSIQETRERIGDLIRSLYEYDRQNLVILTLSEGSLSDIFEEVIYLDSIQASIGEALEDLKAEIKVLELSIETLKERKETILAVQTELTSQISIYNEDKQNKATLLEITKGDEEVYQELLSRIKEQKKQLLGDLSRLSSLRAAEIEALVAKYGPRIPGSSFGNFTYFAQDNGVWANWWINGIPNGGRMKDYGCAITSASIVLKYYGKSVNPGVLSRDSRILYDILISFPATGSVYGIPCVSGCSRSHNINWSTVDNYLNSQKPVILMIETSPYAGDHFVVAIGKVGQKYYVFDPLYSVSQGMAVDLNVSIGNIKGIYGRNASVTRMVIFSP